MLGWRGAPTDTPNFVGLAAGRFDPNPARQFLRAEEAADAAGTAASTSTLSAREKRPRLLLRFSRFFARRLRPPERPGGGRRRSLRRRRAPTNSNMVTGEAELEGLRPTVGYLNGKAAANLVAPWFTGGAKLPIGPERRAGARAGGPLPGRLGHGLFGPRLRPLRQPCQRLSSGATAGPVVCLPARNRRRPPLRPLQPRTFSSDGSRVELTAAGAALEALGQNPPDTLSHRPSVIEPL